jgi:hypothetical protein
MYRSRVFVVATCAALLASLMAPAAVVAAVAAATDAPADPGFVSPTFEEQAGDVVPLELAVPNGSTATLTVAGPSYRTRVGVVDGDDDGHVIVRLNTFLAGWRTTERTAYEAVGADRIASVSRESARRTAPLATGPYALGLSGPVDDTARLDLTAATFDAAVPYAVPRDALPADPADVAALDAPNGTVAAGDWAVVTFHASGLGGVARVDDPPVSNLVYAVGSAPGAASTHHVRHDVAVNGSPTTLTLDYDAGDGGVPSGLARLSRPALAVGYDTDGDGTADVDLGPAVERVTVPRSGTLSVAFADAPPATVGDTLVVELPVTNPDVAGSDSVAVAVDGRRTVGTVEYGLAGSGALGNGLDLRLAPVDARGVPGESRTLPPSLHEVVLDGDRDTLSVAVDTGSLDRGLHALTLSLTPANPTVSRPRSLTKTVTVVDRQVTFVRPDPSFVFDAGYDADAETIPVAIETTLAPGSDLRLHVTSPAAPGVLQVYVLAVDANRTVAVDVTLAALLAGDEINLVVRDGDAVVAGPRAGRPD